MKGIMEQINELEGKTFIYSPPKTKEEYKEFLHDLEKAFTEYDKGYRQRAFEKSRIQRLKAKYLTRKAKELGKDIPEELWVYVVLLDQPVGSWFFEKYNEWLIDEPKKPEEPSNTEMILQHAMNNFPVRK